VAGQDLFDIHTWAYGFQYRGLSNTAMRGNGILALTSEMLTDTNVTLTEASAVTKLASSFSVNRATNTITVTANSTLDDLYDVMKVYKTRPIQAQLEYPTISTQPVAANGDTLVTAMSVVGLEFLTSGTKFKKIQANGTASAAMSNLTVIGNVTQATPTNLSNVVITGTLTYNTNTNTSILITNTSIGVVANSGTGIVTITPTDSSITTYTDAEINFLDSNITFAGVDSITFYPTSGDANTGTNAGATITTSPYNFKYGSVISGVTMIGTLNIRYSIGGKVTIGTLTIALGSNSFVLTDNELLGSINASVALTAKEATLLQTEADIIAAIGSGGGGGGGGSLTAADVWTYSTRTLTTAIPTAAQNATAVRSELATELGRIDVATSTRLSTAGYTAPPTAAAVRAEIDANSTKLDVAVGTRLSSAGYTAPANTDIAAIKAKTDNLPATPASEGSVTARPTLAQIEASTVLAKEATAQAVKSKTDNLPSDPADESSIQAAIAAIPSAPSASSVASAVRTELSTELARVDVAVSTRNSVEPDNTSIGTILTEVNSHPTLAEIEASTVLAKEATLNEIKTNTDLIPAAL
jgi:hypothetical protein